MRDELNAPSLSKLRSSRPVPVEIAVTLAEKLVDPRLGPITACKQDEPEPETSGEVTRFATLIQNTAVFSDSGYQNPDITGGCGLSPAHAKMAALGEAIERYCLSMYNRDDFKTASYADLTEPAVHPEIVNKFTQEQLGERGLSLETITESDYHWTATRALTSGSEVLVPGQLVYIPFDSPITIRSPITTGAAAGIDYESTLYRAICEVVERECFMIGYLNKISFPHVDISTIDDGATQTILSELDALNTDVYILDISLDQPLTTCLAIVVNSQTKPVLSMGMKCDLDPVAAVRGALLEAYQFTNWSPDNVATAKDTQVIETIAQRAQYWEEFEKISKLDFWLSHTNSVEIQKQNTNTSEKKEERAIDQFSEFLEQQDIECYVAEATTSDIANNNFRVLKAVIPEFHPLHLREQYKYLGGRRLYDVPVKTGYMATAKTEENLNRIPHPFL